MDEETKTSTHIPSDDQDQNQTMSLPVQPPEIISVQPSEEPTTDSNGTQISGDKSQERPELDTTEGQPIVPTVPDRASTADDSVGSERRSEDTSLERPVVISSVREGIAMAGCKIGGDVIYSGSVDKQESSRKKKKKRGGHNRVWAESMHSNENMSGSPIFQAGAAEGIALAGNLVDGDIIYNEGNEPANVQKTRDKEKLPTFKPKQTQGNMPEQSSAQAIAGEGIALAGNEVHGNISYQLGDDTKFVNAVHSVSSASPGNPNLTKIEASRNSIGESGTSEETEPSSLENETQNTESVNELRQRGFLPPVAIPQRTQENPTVEEEQPELIPNFVSQDLFYLWLGRTIWNWTTGVAHWIHKTFFQR